MYKIKGQDQREYGPVDAAQVRQWISQGRVDAQTLAQIEGASEWRSLGSFPDFAAAIAPPPIRPTTPPPDNTIATIIPYRNAPALVAYYLGVFSLIPCVGFLLGIAAVVLGVMGLNRARQYPEAKGKAHAWTGIIIGALVVVAHIVLIIVFFVAAAKTARGNGVGRRL